MIGAGSVITRSIPPSTLAVGVPARVIQSLEEMRMRPSEVCSSVATLTEAVGFARSTPMDRLEELELSRLSSGLFPRLAPAPPSQSMPMNGSTKLLAASASSSVSGRTPGTASCSDSTALDDTDHEGMPHSRRRRRRDHSTAPLRSRRHRMLRKCPQLFKSEIMAVVAITSVAFTLLTCLFFAGVFMGAKWFAVLVNSPPGSVIVA